MSANMKHWIYFAILLLLCSAIAFAQTESGQINGTVKDPSGAVVPNAKVTVTNTSTGIERAGNTSSAGLFVFAALKPATYKVVIEAAGFKKSERMVDVNVGMTVDASAQLVVGAQSTIVEVTAEGGGVEVNTVNQTVSTVVTSQQLLEVPTDPNRNPYALVGNSGNVTADGQSNRGAGYAINGQRSASTSILLDGAENVDTFTATVGQNVPLDAVQEFSVLTNNFSAEYGRGGGGVVNLVTKSGTNEWHGSAYEFNRISALAANTYFDNANGLGKSVFTRNNYGFSVGGPIIHKKLFFFENLEWIKVRSIGQDTGSVIDPADYHFLNIASQNFFSAYGTMAPGITQFGYSAGCAHGMAFSCDQIAWAVPHDAGGGSPQNTWDNVAKVDWNITDKTIFSGRYAGFKANYFEGTVNDSPYAGYNTGENDFNQNYTFTLTHIFSPSVVNTTKWVYNRLNQLQGLSSAPIGPTLYIDQNVDPVAGQGLIFPGYNEWTPGSAIPFGGPQNLYQVYDDLSWSRGRHQLKLGGQFIQIRDNRVFGAYEEATEYLGNNLTNGLNNLRDGYIYQFQSAIYPQGKYPCRKDPVTTALITNDPTNPCILSLPVAKPAFGRNYRYNDIAWYAQDSWKITPRLTLNFGVRWEYYGVQHNSDPSLDSNFVMGPGATIYDRIRNGNVELAANGGVTWHPSYGNFGPRVGFAWDPFGDGKTSIRGGYSIGYERNFGNVTFNQIQNPPNYGVISLQSNLDVPYTMPVYTDNNGPLGGSSGSKSFLQVSQRAMDQNMKMAYAESWNLGIERQIFKDALVSATYAGSHGVHLYDISNLNPGGAGMEFLGDGCVVGGPACHPTYSTADRMNLQYTNMNWRSDYGLSFYDALILSFRANNIHKTGVSLTANYTWSHSLDNLSSTFTDGMASSYGLGYVDFFNPRLNYGNSDFDVKHRFILSSSWDLPWGNHSDSALIRNVVGGWSIGGNFTMHSGYPFTLYDSSGADGTVMPFWAYPAGQAHSGTMGPDTGGGYFQYLPLQMTGGFPTNIGESLAMPICAGLYHTGCVYTIGGANWPDRNQFRGPGFWGLDMQFRKSFKIGERFGLEARGEMYDILNHHNFYLLNSYMNVHSMISDPYVYAGKGGFGNSGDEHRYVTLGIRLTF